MNEKDALEILAADKIECTHDGLAPCGDSCPRRIAGEELECRFECGWYSLLDKAEGYLEAVTNLKLPLRDKNDKDLIENIPDINEGTPDFEDEALNNPEREYNPNLDKKSTDGCPTCGNEDIQSAELLEAWKNIDTLKVLLAKAQSELPVSSLEFRADPNAKRTITESDLINWHKRYDEIKKAYIRTRLEVSGSFGNWDYNTRKRVLEHEISTELGFTV